MKENIPGLLNIGVNIRQELQAQLEPTAEVLGGVQEAVARKKWFNEGPGKLDIG